MNFKNIIKALTLCLLAACTAPFSRKYNERTFTEDINEIIEKKILDTSETAQLSLYISMYNNKQPLKGKTYAELWEENQRFQIEEVKKQRVENLIQTTKIEEERKLKESISLSINSKTTTKINNQELTIYSFWATNNTSKSIRAFKGNVIFKDLFDEEISTITLSYNETIHASDSVVCVFQSPYNSFMQSDKKLKEIDLKNLHIEWSPLKIIFTDNSTL